MSKVIAQLRDGSLDIVGDVHGEFDALRQLLLNLGYDSDGKHPDGRTLVFVGDLFDRGHDSPRVFKLVRQLVGAGLAQCVLGNHELNLLRDEKKEGNGWFYDHHKDHEDEVLKLSARVKPADRDGILEFLAALPVALENPSLRVVHACWHADSVQKLNVSKRTVSELYYEFQDATNERLAGGLAKRAEEEEMNLGPSYFDRKAKVRMQESIAEADELYQMGNPIRVMTSGVERRITYDPFFAGGRWRFVERVPWWNEYADKVPVVVGHYWRWRTARGSTGKDSKDLFEGIASDAWFGRNQNVFCIDYSVGHRHRERHGGTTRNAHLGALRWPEKKVLFDDGTEMLTV